MRFSLFQILILLCIILFVFNPFNFKLLNKIKKTIFDLIKNFKN